ncbi:26S protease regulatory subunit S10B -like protein B [Capsicum baccatum]|uniref:26S protease regulatory subunit S10B-like protein B n=1 Tax=Capsicum baccatum TaxID=33114 RepID=A0A2G2W4N8_CAPBA|nr:26S protease regulatory subunit S10B -like protein B [Capsicum baccatum]
MNIRKELWLQHDGSNYTMPGAYYNMSKEDKKKFWALLNSIKFPDGYASNISGCVNGDDATQENQVFYIDDPKLGEDWGIVLKFQARHIYDVPEKENSEAENDELFVTNIKVYQDTLHEEYKVKVDYDGEDTDQENDTMVEYISDHEENEGVVEGIRAEDFFSDSGEEPKDSGLEKKKVNSIRASTDPRIDRSTDKWKQGVLLYGPPGTGKTLLARKIASNIDANFLKQVVSTDIIDNYISESARLIRKIFNYVRDHQIQLVDAISPREPVQTVKSKEYSWSYSIIWMEILKIYAAGINKHGEINYDAAIKLVEAFNGADLRDILYNLWISSFCNMS